MQKQAPSFGRVLTMVLFALSCFGLLLFLWLSFGGAIPLKPKGYQFKIAFPEATTLGLEADVRVAGVRVGKVRAKTLDPKGNRTIATVELDRRFAPVLSTARAILRQKTLLGETYIELTTGTRGSKPIPEGGTLSNGQVQPTVELDEIFRAFDPTTRQAFRTWQSSLAQSFTGRGQDLSDAFGNLPSLAIDGAKTLRILDQENAPLHRLILHTGGVFGALSHNESALHNLIVNSGQVFSATASQNEALATTFHIFPTFLDESKLTLARLRTFAVDTDPLIRDLKPVARELKPTLHDVRLLAPDLKRLFQNLNPLIDASKRGMPALRDTLKGAKPLLASTGPFLSNLNPILEWISLYQKTTASFIGNAAGGLAAHVPTAIPGGPGHYLRQIGPGGAETLGLFPTRSTANRGNTYNPPLYLAQSDSAKNLIFPNWDCKNTTSGGAQALDPAGSGPGAGGPACFVAAPIPFQGKNQRFPNIVPDHY